MAGQLYLGLDGGGTSTRAAGLDESGAVVFEGTGGPGNIAAAGEEGLVRAIRDATQGCPAPCAVAACLAGATGSMAELATATLQRVFPGTPVTVRPDWAATLWATGEGTHAVAIAGTGSAVASKIHGKERVTLGGGPLLCDAGSAFDVVRRYLASALTTGHALPPEIEAGLQTAFGDHDPRIVAAQWRQDGFVTKLAALARLVAESSDPAAVRALDAAMDVLAHAVQSHLDMAGHAGGPTVVEVAGGLWKASPKFMERFRWALSVTGEGTVHRQYTVRPLSTPPAIGAARLARWETHGN